MGPLFHATDENLAVGRVLRGRGAAYTADWSGMSHYAALHAHKPEGVLAHHEAVFLCGLDDTDVCAGGAYVALMRPLGAVSRHDMNWSGIITEAIEAGADPDGPEIAEMCRAYWAGEPSETEGLWEYLAEAAEVIAIVPDEDAETLLAFVPPAPGDDAFRP